MPASGVPPTTKRLRTDPSNQQKAPPITTPWEASKCKVTATLATLPTLHESQKTFLLASHHSFLTLQKKLKTFEARLKEVDVANYVPRSAKFKFELNCSTQLYDTEQTAVDELRRDCSIDLLVVQEKLRQNVVKLIRLEIKSVKSQIEKLFATTVTTTAHTIAIIDLNIAETDAAKIYRSVFNGPHAAKLLQNSCISTANRLYDVLFHLGRDVTPIIFATASTQGSLNTASTQGSHNLDNTQRSATAYRAPRFDPQSQDNDTLPDNLSSVTVFKTVIESIFTDSWTVFLNSENHVSNLKSVQLYLESARAATTSGTTAMDVEELQLPNNKTVEAIITRAVDDKTKSLRAEVSRLRTLVSAKNVTRGAKHPSASAKKKTVTYKNPTDDRHENATRAGGSDNGSKKGKASNKTRPKQSNKNKTTSRKNGRR